MAFDFGIQIFISVFVTCWEIGSKAGVHKFECVWTLWSYFSQIRFCLCEFVMGLNNAGHCRGIKILFILSR